MVSLAINNPSLLVNSSFESAIVSLSRQLQSSHHYINESVLHIAGSTFWKSVFVYSATGEIVNGLAAPNVLGKGKGVRSFRGWDLAKVRLQGQNIRGWDLAKVTVP